MNLFYKDWMLALHPTAAVFTMLGCLVIVPAYPYTMIFMFACLGPYLSFLYSRETNDNWYSAILPVTKKQIVLSKCLFVASLQLGQLFISVPFVFLRSFLNIPNNPVGIDATIAWYGFGLILFSLFDLIFLPSYYRSGYQAGKAFLLSCPAALIVMIFTEASVHLSSFSWLDSSSPQDFVRQLPILLLGLILYPLCMFFAFRISARRFENVDL